MTYDQQHIASLTSVMQLLNQTKQLLHEYHIFVCACFSRVSLIIMSHGTTASELGMFVA